MNIIIQNNIAKQIDRYIAYPTTNCLKNSTRIIKNTIVISTLKEVCNCIFPVQTTLVGVCSTNAIPPNKHNTHPTITYI